MIGKITVMHPRRKSKSMETGGCEMMASFPASKLKIRIGRAIKSIMAKMLPVYPLVALKLCLIAFMGESSEKIRKNWAKESLIATMIPGTIRRRKPIPEKSPAMISVASTTGR